MILNAVSDLFIDFHYKKIFLILLILEGLLAGL